MFNIGEFSKITGLTKRALRFYESKYLLKPEKDRENGYRNYSKNDYQKILKIEFYKRLGFSLDEIKEILEIIQSDISGFENKLKVILEKLEIEKTRLNEQEYIIKKVMKIINDSKNMYFEQMKLSEQLNIKERKVVMEKLQFSSTYESTIGKRK